MKNNPQHKRIGFAIAGIRDGWCREQSFRGNVVFAASGFAALCIVRPSPIWWAVIVLAVIAGLAMELINGALEALVDHLHPEIHPQIRIAKDMAAASVFLINCAAIAVMATMLLDYVM